MIQAIGVLIAVVFIVPSAVVVAYYVFFAVLRLLHVHFEAPASVDPRTRFIVLIPAHNEETLIQETLNACSQWNYPADKVRIVVIADNCTDKTSQIVHDCGRECWVRRDDTRRGKGEAIRWGLCRALSSDIDAVVILDADCSLDPFALRRFDYCLEQGHHVLQANHTSIAISTPLALVGRIGQILEYDYFYVPKSSIGGFVPLVGSGMAFTSDCLNQNPWNASGLVEDVEYSLNLAAKRIPVRFVGNAVVQKQAERKLSQLEVQRRRWAQGTLGLVPHGLRLIGKGIRSRQLFQLDAGWTLLTMSRPVIGSYLLLSCIICVVFAIASDSTLSAWLLFASVAVCLAYWAYFGLGLIAIGINWKVLKMLCEHLWRYSN